MHTADLLEEAAGVARDLGYEVREDWLGGEGSGHCLVRGRKLILLDLAQPVRDRLDYLLDALREEQQLGGTSMSADLEATLAGQRAA